MKQIRTTHVGSLPRPAEMVARNLRKVEISSSDLEEYIEQIVGRQLSVGLAYINNGELPRSDYISATVQRVSGLNGTCQAPFPRDLEDVPEYSRRFSGRNGLITLNPKATVDLPACSSELGYTGEASLREELEMLKRAFDARRNDLTEDGTDLFLTAPSPGTIALFLKNLHYPDYWSYLEKLGEILKMEYEIINEYGVYLQVDCPDLAMGRHTAFKSKTDNEFYEIIEANIDVLNRALSGIAPEKCRAHICWGNYPGTHHHDIELKNIYSFIMKLRPRFISIESCNHRHAHESALFETTPFPEDKVLMPGVIDTSSNTVEHPDLVAQRLQKFASVLGPERVIGSTDCGFASTAGAASVSGEVAWLKLTALVEGARRASGKL